MSNLNKCLTAVLKHEGGFIKHPKQPDLSSNSGITKKVYEGWAKKSVTEDQLESLSKTEIALFYKEKYWKVLQCDDLPHGVDLIVFDFAISAGPYKAIIKLQQAVNCYLDGNMGQAPHRRTPGGRAFGNGSGAALREAGTAGCAKAWRAPSRPTKHRTRARPLARKPSR